MLNELRKTVNFFLFVDVVCFGMKFLSPTPQKLLGSDIWIMMSVIKSLLILTKGRAECR